MTATLVRGASLPQPGAVQDHSLVQPLIDVRGLRVTFRQGPGGYASLGPSVVEDLSFQLLPGSVLALVGESGSGKSVTARSLVGLAGRGAVVTADRLTILREDARGFDERSWRRLRGRGVGFVLQDAMTSLDPLRTIGAEIWEGATGAGQAIPASRRNELVEGLLWDVGISEPTLRRRQYPHQLSGGQRQRALIASALAANPDVLIADEPTTALDVTVQAQVLALLAEQARLGKGMIFVSHDLAVVAQIADHVLVLKQGRIVESGPVARVLGDPQHEYTRKLIAAIPDGRSRGRRLGGPVAEPGDGQPRRKEPKPLPEWSADRPLLSVVDIRKTYQLRGRRALTAVDGVSLTLGQSQIIGIVGESGSGKSTIAKIVTGFVTPDSGHVRFGWQDGSGSGHGETALGKVQLVAQDSYGSFDPRYTTQQIIGESVAIVESGRAAILRRVAELLDVVRLPRRVLGMHPRELSGGQRQRVNIARALGSEPWILVCDEPVSALDVSVQAQILDLLADIRTYTNAGFLFISHDIGVVHHLSDRVLVMQQGRVVEEGDADAVFTSPISPYTRQLLLAVPKIQSAFERSGHDPSSRRSKRR